MERTLTERVKKVVQGHFKIQVVNPDTGEVLDSYEDYNKVVVWVYRYFGEAVYGFEPPDIDKFRIHSFAIGTNGVDEYGRLKEISDNQKQMYSEMKFWEGDVPSEEQRQAYVYQISFEKPSDNDEHYAFKTDEGATYPAYSNRPKDYRGHPYNDIHEIEGCISMKRSFQNGVLKQHIYVGKLAANGHPMWEKFPEFNEAALFMPEGTAESGNPLGTLFSMKTFPSMMKSPECVIIIDWDLDFRLNDGWG
jgi:hypothetical protein